MWADIVRGLLDVVVPRPAPVEADAGTAEAPGEPELWVILLGEATRAAEGQRAAVDGLHTRAGIVLASVALVISYFGPDRALAVSQSGAGMFAAACAALAVLLAAWILIPADWGFDTDFHDARKKYVECEDRASVGELARSLAWNLEKRYPRHKKMLGRRYWALEGAVLLTALQAAGWLVAINQG